MCFITIFFYTTSFHLEGYDNFGVPHSSSLPSTSNSQAESWKDGDATLPLELKEHFQRKRVTRGLPWRNGKHWDWYKIKEQQITLYYTLYTLLYYILTII